jgi:phage/plasmid-like protein (TIGR03299 family)
MAHNIEFSIKTNTHSMFSVKEVPWHGLGQIVDKALTSEEAIKAANLDFTVIKKPNYIKHEGVEYANPFSYGTFRTDNKTILGSVGKDYTIVQNKDAFIFFDSIVGDKKAIFETAGVLGKGEQVFITAKLPKSIVLDNIDVIDQYLLLSNAHDGTRSIEVLFTPIRVVCNNTLTAALNYAKNRIKIRHTASAHDRLKEAHKLLGIHSELVTEQESYFNILKDRQITPEEFKTYVCHMFLSKSEVEAVAYAGLKNLGEIESITTRKMNIMKSVSDYFVLGPGQDLRTTKETMWGAYNAITGYYHNARNFADADTKMRRNLYGANYISLHKAYTCAIDIATNKMPLLTEDGKVTRN